MIIFLYLGDGPLLRRRRTTDLSDVIPETSSSSSASSKYPNDNSEETFTIKLRKTGSVDSDSSSEPSSPSTASPATKRLSPTPKITLSEDSAGTGTSNSRRLSEDVTLPDSTLKPKKKKKRLLIQGVQEVSSGPSESNDNNESEFSGGQDSSADVAFIIQV